jgi:hypothetical protein
LLAKDELLTRFHSQREVFGRSSASRKIHVENATVKRRLFHGANVPTQERGVRLVPAELDHVLPGSAGLARRQGSFVEGARLSSELDGKHTKTEGKARDMHKNIDTLAERVIPFNPIGRI